MASEMIAKARANAASGGYDNVEFRLGEIENLPVPDGSVDVILSNCVINLSPEKPKVFAEAFRVLKPGGVLTLSDVVLLKPLPPMLAASASAYLGCVAGAGLKAEYLDMLRAAGFADVKVVGESPFYLGDSNADPIVKAIIEEADLTPERVAEIGPSIVSIKVAATKSSAA